MLLNYEIKGHRLRMSSVLSVMYMFQKAILIHGECMCTVDANANNIGSV